MFYFYAGLVLFIAINVYFKWQNGYWKRRKIRGPTPKPIFGNLFDYFMMRRHFGEIYRDIYQKFPNCSFVGVYKFSAPAVLLRDTELIKSVLIDNFDNCPFIDFQIDPRLDPLMSKSPSFSENYEKWKMHRSQLSPVFTNAKIKIIFPLLEDVCKRLVEYIEYASTTSKYIKHGFEAKTLCSKATIESITSCAFGLEAEAFTNEHSLFIENARKIFETNIIQTIRNNIALFVPFVNKIIDFPFLPKEVDCWIRSVTIDVVNRRNSDKEKPKMNFLQMLLEKQTKSNANFDEDLLVGHALSLLLDGFETSSITMTYCLYRLAKNPEILRKVQMEIDDALDRSNGKLTEVSVRSMEYLEKILFETLRIDSPDLFMARVCTKDFKLPPQCPEDEDGVLVTAGTSLIIPVLSIHNNPKFYPNPEIFDPERFSEANIEMRPKCSYLAFGEGPRICPGMKFGMIQTKACLASILSKFDVELSERTIEPLSISPKSIFRLCENGIWIRFKKRCV